MFVTWSASNALTELSSDGENKFVRSIRILEPTKLKFKTLTERYVYLQMQNITPIYAN